MLRVAHIIYASVKIHEVHKGQEPVITTSCVPNNFLIIKYITSKIIIFAILTYPYHPNMFSVKFHSNLTNFKILGPADQGLVKMTSY